MSYCSGSCGYSSGCGSSGYSRLESIADSYGSGSGYNSNVNYSMSEAAPKSMPFFENAETKPFSRYGLGSSNYKNQDYTRASKPRYYSAADPFLRPNRSFTPFIGEVSEIRSLIEEAFEKTTGFSFPNDITVELLDDEGMKKAHQFNKNIHGFAINRKSQGLISSVFVRKDELAKVMLTLGHEIGHAFTFHLGNKILEEAKAFAFQMKWMEAIKENNIGNLSTQIELDKPALNGIHNVALDFVLEQINEGRDVFDVHWDIVRGGLKIGG
jgi:hypothetical protein